MQQPQSTLKQQTKALIRRCLQLGMPYAECVRMFKKEFIVLVLVAHRGNQCRAAHDLGMHRNTLGRMLAELQIDARLIRSVRLRSAAEARIARRKPVLVTAAVQGNHAAMKAATQGDPAGPGGNPVSV